MTPIGRQFQQTARRRHGRPKNPGLVGQRQEEILSAASGIFAAQGYAATDVQYVADQLGIAKGTVYLYFPSKEKLFFAAVDRAMRQLSEFIRESRALQVDTIEGVKIAVRAFLAFFDRHPQLVELLIQERAVFKQRKRSTFDRYQSANIKPWRERLRAEIAAGRIRKIPVRRITETMSNLLYGIIFTQYYTAQRRSFESQFADIIDIFLHGISKRNHTNRHRSAAGQDGL